MSPRIKKNVVKRDGNNIQVVRQAVKRAHDQIDETDAAARIDRAFNREMPFRFDEVKS
jgi:hypothetical protein